MSTRRRIALVLATGLTALPLSACTIRIGDGSSAPRQSTTSEGTDGTDGQSGQAGPTQELKVGAMSVRIPVAWQVVPEDKGAGRWHVLTGGSCDTNGYPEADTCRGFWVFGGQDIALGNEGAEYTPDRPFYPRTDSVPCPNDPESFQTTPQAPAARGFADVGDHKGHYREWRITCISPAGGAATGDFVQRVVYLPESRILLVDNWQTTGLAGHLRTANWS
jgi:hypothetical protein